MTTFRALSRSKFKWFGRAWDDLESLAAASDLPNYALDQLSDQWLYPKGQPEPGNS